MSDDESDDDTGEPITAESVELRHEHEIHVGQAVEEVEEAIEERREKIEDKTEEAIETVEKTVEEVEETVGEQSEKLGERARKSGEKMGETMDEQRENVGERTERALEALDESVNRLLTEALETETRVATYVALRRKDGATVDEVVEETGFYPDKVESVLGELEDDGIVESEEGIYDAVPPTDLVSSLPKRVGSWVGSFIRRESAEVSKIAEGEFGVPEDDDEPELKAEYDEENEVVTVRVEDPGGSDYVNVLVGGEVGHTFHFPSEGDEVTLNRSSGEKVTAESGDLVYEEE